MDRCLEMPAVAAALQARGVEFRLHRQEFAPDAPDEEWLPVVGERGWVILTRDAAMRHIPTQWSAIEAVGARQFVIRGKNLSADAIVGILDKHWGRIAHHSAHRRGGFIAHVTGSGVNVMREFPRLRKR